jgi:hypothetical protein
MDHQPAASFQLLSTLSVLTAIVFSALIVIAAIEALYAPRTDSRFCHSFAAKSDVSCRKLSLKRKAPNFRSASVDSKYAVGGRCTQNIRHPFLSVS